VSRVGRLDRRKEKTKQTIVAAAMRLIQKQGFDGTTMEQIAEQADVAKGTLYNYFPAKEAIISEWVRRTSIEKYEAGLRELPALPDTRTRMTAVFEAYMEGVQAQKDLFEKYVIYQMQQLVSFDQNDVERSGLAIAGREIIKLGQESGELVSDLPVNVLEDMIEVIFIQVVKQFYKNPAAFQSRKVIERMVDLFLYGAKENEPTDNV
jgi:AcrR family transcriptional regulator